VLHRFGIDPAVSPDSFVAAVTDVVGYGPSLGIAAVGFGLA
jgi:Mg/Co/Ni transporter MgtE